MLLENRSAALALGSGSARGLAHIGVIRVLEEAGLSIEAVAGCSMGALVGGIYAAGKLAEYEAWARDLTEMDVLRLVDFALGTRAGLIKGEAVIAVLKTLVGDHDIEELSIPFTAVATDLGAGREVWLDRGKLFDAIRASIAIPALIRPMRHNGRWLLDGGLLNPVPIAPTLATPTDLKIAVSVTGRAVPEPLGPLGPSSSPKGSSRFLGHIDSFMDSVRAKLGTEAESEASEGLSLIDVVLSSFETMQQTITRFKLAAYQPDLLVEVPINVCQGHEYYRADEIISAGEHWARVALERWREEGRFEPS